MMKKFLLFFSILFCVFFKVNSSVYATSLGGYGANYNYGGDTSVGNSTGGGILPILQL